MSTYEDQSQSGAADRLIWAAGHDSYVSFVSQQVMRGVVEHNEVEPDWILPRMAHIGSKYRLNDGEAYEALRLSEELVSAAA